MVNQMLVLGNTGFLGRHVEDLARKQGWETRGISLSAGFDLRDPGTLEGFIREWRPQVIVNCAAHVGGITYSQDKQATVMTDNIRITLAVLESISGNNSIRLVNPIANCSYPGNLSSFREDDFWRGGLHLSVLGYGGARRFAVLASEAFRQQFELSIVDVALPNLFGPGDHLDPVRAHALGGLVSRILVANEEGREEVKVWGSGKPIREWLYVQDAARALLLAADARHPPKFLNVGTGNGISIAQLAEMICEIVGFSGELVFDTSFPDGAGEKRMIAERAFPELGWNPNMTLREGLVLTVADAKRRLMSVPKRTETYG